MEEKTKYQLSTSVSEGIVEIVITGEVTKNTIDRLHAEVITILSAKNAKAVLCDVRVLKAFPEQLASAFFRARSIPADVKILPSAVVDLLANEGYKSFYETTAANVGHSMKFFTDIEAARAWLKSRL